MSSTAEHDGLRRPSDAVSPEILQIHVQGCNRGVGLSLDAFNTITELKLGLPAADCLKFLVGDVIVAVDGEALEGRELQNVMRPGDAHVFAVQRGGGAQSGWMERIQDVRVPKQGGVLGFKMGVAKRPDGSQVVRVLEVLPGSPISALGTVSHGDAVLALHALPVHDADSLQRAAAAIDPLPNGTAVSVRVERRMLIGGWMLKVSRHRSGLASTPLRPSLHVPTPNAGAPQGAAARGARRPR